MALSVVTYALAKKYTDNTVFTISEDVIARAVALSKQYTDTVATQIEWKTKIVVTLPSEDIDLHTIYFVPAGGNVQDDGYFEYLYINNRWEVIGRTVVDLSNYYTKAEVNELILQYLSDPNNLPKASNGSLGVVAIDEESLSLNEDGTVRIETISNDAIADLFGTNNEEADG